MIQRNELGVRLLLNAIDDGMPVGVATGVLATRWGAPFLGAVRRGGLGQEQLLDDDDRYPCGRAEPTSAHCHRVVQIDEGGIAHARCGLLPPMCPTSRLRQDEAVRWVLTPAALATWLASRLGFIAGVHMRADAVRVGERRLGGEGVAAYFLLRPSRVDGTVLDAWRSGENARHLLLLSARTEALPPDLVAAARQRRHRAVGLDRILDVVDGELTASLAGVATELGEDIVFDVSALTWPRFWMAFEPERDRALVGEAGVEIDLTSKPGLVLRRLLRDRRKTVSNLELFRAGWRNIPAPKRGQGMDPGDEQKVRDAVTALRSRVKDALPASLHEKFKIDTERATEQGLGGYRLVVPEGRVLWGGPP